MQTEYPITVKVTSLPPAFTTIPSFIGVKTSVALNSPLALTINPADAQDPDVKQPVPLITLTETPPAAPMTLITTTVLSADFKNIDASPTAFSEIGTHNFVLKLIDDCKTEKAYNFQV